VEKKGERERNLPTIFFENFFQQKNKHLKEAKKVFKQKDQVFSFQTLLTGKNNLC
jgi:hypothetical protein